MKHKQQKNIKKKAVALFSLLITIFVFTSGTSHAQVGDNGKSCKDVYPEYKVSYIISGGVKQQGGTSYVSPGWICCCNSLSGISVGSQECTSSGSSKCVGIAINKLERSDFITAPTDTSFRIDAGSPNYPLKGVASVVEKWYAAMFYLAVVLAIIQIFRGGIEYAIAAGNSGKTEEAKGIIIEAVIGLGVALLAAAILVFLRGPGVFTFTA